ncbi:MAG: cadherin-like domain-containing protein [Terrimonas ferruginea]|uniref:Ig-like domain-containing protein n=1 Tax=Terrimonas ferruginea TaxID=249 RepID=UPI000B194582|nr:Ig-like domain-containing protein [Terrimonas ferruginea]MBN8784295.1 cadherin-like domain-containing protein [Terrimonas ferruginea]
MKKFYTILFSLAGCFNVAFSQCTPATVRGTANLNTPNYTLNTAFNSGNAAPATINNLSSGMFSFTGSVAGTARWGNGIQIQNDATVGNYIYVQPNNTNNTGTANIATYTIDFTEAVTNFSLRCAGLNNQDQLRITAFNGATPITISAANFSDNVADPGNSGTIVISNGNTLTGNNTAGGTSVNTNRITLNIPGPVTRIVMTSGKADANNTSTVTLGFTSVSYTRCVNVPPDINATFVNTAVTGNVGTNDIQPTGTTYGTAVAKPGNPTSALPVINANGTYSFTAAVVGVYKFSVPMCPGSVVSPDCPLIDLIITVSDANATTNKPFANTDMATTPINTAVTLNTLANDKAGNNTSVSLNASSVTITQAPLHGTVTVNSSNGNITYTPNNGYTGYDTLIYQVADLSSPTPQTATAYQIITILPAARANGTLASDDYNSTRLNTAVSGSVVINDSDPEGNPQTITAQNTTISGRGTLLLSTSGFYTFTPATGYSGPVNFPYQVCDDGSPVACANATLYLLVFPSATTLPLTLTSFNATVSDRDVKLNWSTDHQDNVSRFEIERSAFASNAFTVVGTVAVNNGLSGSYAFTDVNAKAFMEKGYYRLKIIDNDGRYSYSRVNLVNFGSQMVTSVNPTLVTGGQTVTLYTGASASRQTYTGEIYNQGGQLVRKWTGTIGQNKQIETAELQKGVYVIRVTQETGAGSTNKFIVQ